LIFILEIKNKENLKKMHLENKIDHEIYEELLENFVILHENQFLALGLPEIFWRDLCMKLKDEVKSN